MYNYLLISKALLGVVVVVVVIIIIIIIIIFQGLGLFACSGFRTFSLKLFGQLVGLLRRGIGPTQGLYLHGTTQHRKFADTHPCLEWDSNPRSQCSSGRGQYVPQISLGQAFGNVEVNFVSRGMCVRTNNYAVLCNRESE
jgi:hypothetical protein